MITYERTSDEAYTSGFAGSQTPLGYQRFVASLGLCECGAAILARDGEQVVGVFRYLVWQNGRRMIVCFGTWVSYDYRRRGIAREMWRTASRLHRTRLFEVVAVSNAGKAFVAHMAGGPDHGTMVLIPSECQRVQKEARP